MKKKEVKFVFDNEDAAKHFVTWLCEQGEQGYWQWMEVRETEESGPITVTRFDYWENDKKKFGEGDVLCECGRLET